MADQPPLWERLLSALGFNPTRLRWKVEIHRERQRKRRLARDNRAKALQYRHKVCPGCGLTVDRAERHCPRCGAPQRSAIGEQLHRHVRALIPAGVLSYATLFVLLDVAFYLAMLMQSGGAAALGHQLDPRVVLRFGAWFIPLVLAGQWWRLVTPIFLHFGLLHLIFNCLWLLQLGPLLEQTFGRSRFLLLYLTSGVAGFLVSIAYRIASGHGGGIGGGASGVVFGLIAAALVVGYLRRGPGSEIYRQGLVKWALYGIIFSLLPGVDLAAHLGGGLGGGLLALVLAPEGQARRLPRAVWLVIELGCLAVIAASFALTILVVPPGLGG